MGEDFSFTTNDELVRMIELMKKIKKRSSDIEIVFATPSEYFEAVYRENIKFNEFGGDLFPLISRDHGHYKTWTGYYSTMPFLKNQISEAQLLSRSIEIVQAARGQTPFRSKQLALAAHHDAITATSRQQVIEDYLKLIAEEKKEILHLLGKNFDLILNTTEPINQLAVPFKVLYLFNPLGWSVEKTHSFESENEFIKIFDSNGNIESQSVIWNQNFRIFFHQRLAPYTLKIIFISEHATFCSGCSEPSTIQDNSHISNKFVNLTFEKGFLDTAKYNNIRHFLHTKLIYYDSGANGPYTFAPTVIYI